MKIQLLEISTFYMAIASIVTMMVVCITLLVVIESKTRKHIAFDQETIIAVSNSKKLTGVVQLILGLLAVATGIFYLVAIGL